MSKNTIRYTLMVGTLMFNSLVKITIVQASDDDECNMKYSKGILQKGEIQEEQRAIKLTKALQNHDKKQKELTEAPKNKRNKALLDALESGRKEKAKSAIANGADVNAKMILCNDGTSACKTDYNKWGRVDNPSSVSDVEYDTNDKDEELQTPLWFAIRCNAHKIADLLLESGATLEQSWLNQSSNHCEMPLEAFLAAYQHNNRMKMLKVLLKHGAIVNQLYPTPYLFTVNQPYQPHLPSTNTTPGDYEPFFRQVRHQVHAYPPAGISPLQMMAYPADQTELAIRMSQRAKEEITNILPVAKLLYCLAYGKPKKKSSALQSTTKLFRSLVYKIPKKEELKVEDEHASLRSVMKIMLHNEAAANLPHMRAIITMLEVCLTPNLVPELNARYRNLKQTIDKREATRLDVFTREVLM